MDAPKISVLIPMYNRKHYIEDCVNSVLNQTFQDFEIIIRDDNSTDGVFEFVQEKYSNEISTGKIKLFHNEENLGEGKTTNKLILDATGKYFTFLHNDDIYMPYALQHLYEVAENFSADVVHASGFFVTDDENIRNLKFSPTCYDRHPVNKVEVMSDNPTERFKEWHELGTFHDIQYNIFNRRFILDNEIFHDEYEAESLFFTLWWIMLAKVFVKTPILFYVRRNSPNSQSGEKIFSPAQIEKFISAKIELSRHIDKLFNKVKFFRDNKQIQFTVKSRIFIIRDNVFIYGRKTYSDGITLELQNAVENAFKKYFGDDYFYPALLYHWAHVMPYNKPVDKIVMPFAPDSRNS